MVQVIEPVSARKLRTKPYQVTSPAPREVWEDLVRKDPNTLVYQTPAWTDGICASGENEDASRLYETGDGRILLLPLVRRKAPTPGLSFLASMPDGWGTGGVISADPIHPEDIQTILDDLVSQQALGITIRPNPLAAEMWTGVNSERFKAARRDYQILNLEGGFEQVWTKRFPSATRNGIRRGEKAGLVIESGSGGVLLPLFYELYLVWIDRRARERHVPGGIARWLGKRREPLHKFQSAAKALGDAFQVWIARVGNQPAAGAILLIEGNHASYWRSYSDKGLAAPPQANYLLQSRMIEAACQAGCRYYHMGESGGVASLIFFKQRFGAEEYFYPKLYQERIPLTSSRDWLNGVRKKIEDRIINETKAEA